MVEGEDQVSRSEFFKKVLRKTVGTAMDIAENFVAPLNNLTNMVDKWEEVWEGSLPENQAKFIFHRGKPIFLYRFNGAISAFSGFCPNDSNLVSISPNKGFVCTYCGNRFEPGPALGEYRLQEFPVKVEGEKVFVVFGN